MYTIIGGDGQEYGPVTGAQVRTWLAAGRANLETRAKLAGSDEWQRLGDFSEFTGGPAEPPPLAANPGFTEFAEGDPAAIAAGLIARAGKLDISSCYERSWNLLKSNFWPLVGVPILVMLVEVVVTGFTVVHPLAAYPTFGFNSGALVVSALFKGGLYFYFLKKIRGLPTSVGDAFAGFSRAFIPLLLLGVVSSLLILLGSVCFVLPGIYLGVSYAFAAALCTDKKIGFWTAMEVSRRVITAQWWRVFGLLLLAIPFMLLGMVCLLVGIFVAIPFVYGAIMFAYEDLCNPPAGSNR